MPREHLQPRLLVWITENLSESFWPKYKRDNIKKQATQHEICLQIQAAIITPAYFGHEPTHNRKFTWAHSSPVPACTVRYTSRIRQIPEGGTCRDISNSFSSLPSCHGYVVSVQMPHQSLYTYIKRKNINVKHLALVFFQQWPWRIKVNNLKITSV